MSLELAAESTEAASRTEVPETCGNILQVRLLSSSLHSSLAFTSDEELIFQKRVKLYIRKSPNFSAHLQPEVVHGQNQERPTNVDYGPDGVSIGPC